MILKNILFISAILISSTSTFANQPVTLKRVTIYEGSKFVECVAKVIIKKTGDSNLEYLYVDTTDVSATDSKNVSILFSTSEGAQSKEIISSLNLTSIDDRGWAFFPYSQNDVGVYSDEALAVGILTTNKNSEATVIDFSDCR